MQRGRSVFPTHDNAGGTCGPRQTNAPHLSVRQASREETLNVVQIVCTSQLILSGLWRLI